MNAVTMLIVGVVVSLSGACAIAYIEDAPLHQCLFEAVSAFGTVGLTMGLTPSLHTPSCLILIVLMYLGRAACADARCECADAAQGAAQAAVSGGQLG